MALKGWREAWCELAGTKARRENTQASTLDSRSNREVLEALSPKGGSQTEFEGEELNTSIVCLCKVTRGILLPGPQLLRATLL